jgi:hypothetical protein
MTRKIIALLIVVVVGVGGYLELYRPSQQAILTGLKPIAQDKQLMMPVTPLGELPEPARTRVSDTLRNAARTIEPGYRIDEEQLFVHPGGWDALRKLTGQYVQAKFGFREQTDAEKSIGANTFDYLVWRGGWLRRFFDDRVLLAVEYFEPVSPGFKDGLLGYFVMRPDS